MIRRRNNGPFLAQKDGTFAINLAPDVLNLLTHMFGELRDVLIQADTTDPALRRLFPVAYNLDPESDEEYQRLMRSELVASRLAGISRAIEIIETSNVLSGPDLIQFMQALNSIRLLLGTMLDVGEDHEPEDYVPRQSDSQSDSQDEDPRIAQHHLYAYLGWLVESAVSVQTGRGGKLLNS